MRNQICRAGLLSVFVVLAAAATGGCGAQRPVTVGRAVDYDNTGEAQITLFPNVERHRVSPYIYGQFIEHLGGCIYDGIWVGRDSEIENIDGIRLDTVNALKKLELPVVRWPGGLFADNYHWREGIGPRDKRPVRQNLGWNTTETNQFGTNEFMRFCELIGTEPYLCVNMGSGSVEEARSWAEYCNSDKDTTLTRLRAENGHPEPFNVKFWSLGNEPGYQMDGMMMPEYYFHLARNYAGYIKHFASQAVLRNEEKFKVIKTILAISPGWFDTFSQMTSQGGRIEFFDLLSSHVYVGRRIKKNVTPQQEYYLIIAALSRMEGAVDKYCDYARQMSTRSHSVEVAVDEWGIWRKEATPYNGLAQDAAMLDALYAAACFHILHRDEKIYMANMAQTINVLQAVILTRGEDFCVTPTYYVFEMFKPHRSGKVIDFNVNCSRILPLPDKSERNALSVSATKSQDGSELFVSVVNLDLRKDITANIRVSDTKDWQVQKIQRLVGENIDSKNTFEVPNHVCPKAVDAGRLNDDGKFTFKAQSITTIMMSKK